MVNPDYSPELYSWQDAEVEDLPKDMENRDLGFVLEAAGDIFREIVGRTQPDGHYIAEKVNRIERTLKHPIDRQEVFASLSDADEERTDLLQQKWFSLKELSPRLTAVRNLNIALSDQNEAGAWFNLRRFKEEWARSERFVSRREHRSPDVRVRSHRRMVK
jgi:hypothetical protein